MSSSQVSGDSRTGGGVGPERPPVVVVTGSASGIGAACAARFESSGYQVVGVDRHRAEVAADLATVAGRAAAIEAVHARCPDGRLDALVTCAGVAGGSETPGSLVVSVNYFGTVALLEGLRPLLAAAPAPAAVAISSNSTTVQPGIPTAVTDACLAGDEDLARTLADDAGSLDAYPASKLAVARWVRDRAVTADWAGAGICLNAVAPGVTATPMVSGMQADPKMGPLLALLPVPVGRPGRPEEIAALIALLIGDDGRFFCGSVLLCDGGSEALVRPDDWPAPLSRGWHPRSTG